MPTFFLRENRLSNDLEDGEKQLYMKMKFSKSRRMTLEVEMNSCNQNCRHCYAGGGKEKYLCSLSWLKWVYNEFKSVFNGEVLLDIGYLLHQITLHPHFFKILDWLQSNFDKRLNRQIITNGTMIARDKNFFSNLMRRKINSFQLTLYGIGNTHDNFARRKGSYKDIIQATERAKSAGLLVFWNIHMRRRMVGEIPPIYTLSQKYDIDEIAWVSASPVGNFIQRTDLRVRQRDIEKYKSIIKSSLKYLKTEREIIESLSSEEKPCDKDEILPEPIFCIRHNEEVYRFFSGYTPYAYYGNLRKKGAKTIIERKIKGIIPWSRVREEISKSEVAKRYGNPYSDLLYYPENLINYWYYRYWLENYGMVERDI